MSWYHKFIRQLTRPTDVMVYRAMVAFKTQRVLEQRLLRSTKHTKTMDR